MMFRIPDIQLHCDSIPRFACALLNVETELVCIGGAHFFFRSPSIFNFSLVFHCFHPSFPYAPVSFGRTM